MRNYNHYIQINNCDFNNVNQMNLPQTFEGVVIKGFGRGSKELGCPTANIPVEPYEKILLDFPLGVYWGLASVNDGPVYGMAMNVGWSPFYKNKEKTVEIHVLNKFDDDFYGQHIKAVALGYIRPEANFNSVEDLKSAIQNDLTCARKMLANESLFDGLNVVECYKKYGSPGQEDTITISK